MSLKLKVEKWDNKEKDISIDTEPDLCPLCNTHQTPVRITAFMPANLKCEIIYRCSNKRCLAFFIGYYLVNQNVEYRLYNTRPRQPIPISFEPEIRNLSPNFCEIYEEAYFCEGNGYKQVAGAGYRKALEYLIKDFCISNHSDKSEEIKNMFLGKCIKTYLEDKRMKKCAERATWLGNDETHYVRKWGKKDISDLKTLITLTKNWIVSHIQTYKYIEDMKPESK